MEFELVYSAVPLYNFEGGVDQGFVYIDNIDVTATVHLDQLMEWNESLSLFIYGLGNNGGKATELMGDFQVAANIEAPQSYRIFEVWLQQNFLNDHFSVLTGLYDLNSEFDVLTPATVFINSSFGIGAEYAQTGLNGPSIFPVSSLGVRLSASINKYIKLKLAMLDAVPGDPSDPTRNNIKLEDGALIAFETSLFTRATGMQLNRGFVTRRKKVGREHEIPTDDKLNIGGWYYTSEFIDLKTGDNSLGNWGAYIGAQKYWFYSKYDDRYLAFFGRIGWAADQYNRIGTAISAGILSAGSASGKTDYIGLGFTKAINGSTYMDENTSLEASETAIELTFSTPIRTWLTIQPDIQYIINPNSDPKLQNSLAGGVLFQLSF